MVVGTLCLELRLEGAFNLKDKRRILRSLMDRARRDFHVAVAETDDLDLWNSSVVGVACVSNDAAHAESVLSHVTDLFDACPNVELVAVDRSIERR